MLQRRESVIGFYRQWRYISWYLRQSRRAGSRSQRTDTSGTYVSQRSSRRTVHHSTHVMMSQLRLDLSQRMRVTLKARMNHGRRKSGADPMNFAHIVTDVWVQAVLHPAGWRIVVFPLAVIVTRAGLRPRRRGLGRLRRCWRCLAVRVLPAHVLRVWQLVVFLPFHTAVLEPDFDLSLRQDQIVSDLDSSSSRQVPIEVEFLFQFEYLMPRVGSSLSLWLHSRCVRAVCCKNRTKIAIWNYKLLFANSRYRDTTFLSSLSERNVAMQDCDSFNTCASCTLIMNSLYNLEFFLTQEFD